jgi:hypothetical protein
MVIVSAGHRLELSLSFICATLGRRNDDKARIHRCITFVEAIEYHGHRLGTFLGRSVCTPLDGSDLSPLILECSKTSQSKDIPLTILLQQWGLLNKPVGRVLFHGKTECGDLGDIDYLRLGWFSMHTYGLS